MASDMSDAKLAEAEDTSQNSCSQSDSMNSVPNLKFSTVSDSDTIDNNLKKMEDNDEASQDSNNANMANPFFTPCEDETNEQDQNNTDRPSNDTEDYVTKTTSISIKVNYSFESDSDEDFCVLRRSRSDELLELKHQFQVKESSEAQNDYPSPVSEINAKEYLELQKDFAEKAAGQGLTSPQSLGNPYSACNPSPGAASEGSDQYPRDRHVSEESNCEERIRSIEEEYIQRISTLEERHYELEDVLARLTSSLEPLFETPASDEFKPEDVAEAYAEVVDDVDEDYEVEKAKIDELLFKSEQQKKRFARMIGLELFLEFQRKIRSFTVELNGVLNCSEAAIRHARVVQEWGTSVQLMFEDLKEERMKMQDFIDERERNVIILRNQFASELEQQGRILHDLVTDMKTYRDLYATAEKYGGTVAPNVTKIKLAKSIIDLLMKQRVEGEKALILDLKKQSKISEMKLLIIHQQSFIQQIQEQNRELRAIIEGLMGPEEILAEMNDSEPCTPASASSPERNSLRLSLDKLLDKSLDPPVCKISDVLDCDRGETYPGISTDGDIATLQTFEIGRDSKRINTGEPVIYDPLSIPYIRDQCRAVEETERRQQLMAEEDDENKENIDTDSGVQTFRDGVDVINVEPYLRKTAVDEDLEKTTREEVTDQLEVVGDIEAGGDGSEALITTKISPLKDDRVTTVEEYDDNNGYVEDINGYVDVGVDIDDIGCIVDNHGLTDDIPVIEPPIIDIENTNNNDYLD